MPTIKLVPSTYYLSNTSYLSVSNDSNMYNDTDSTTYATVTNTRTSTTSYYIYLQGFNFDDVPSAAIVSDITIKIKAYHTGGNTSTIYCYEGTSMPTQVSSAGSTTALTTSATVKTFTNTIIDWETLKGYGSDFGIRINCRRSSRNTTSYIYIYGAEIDVTYTMPVSATVTSTLTGNGTIDPSGAYSTYEGSVYELTITPTDVSEPVTASKDGIDITSELVAHGAESSTTVTPHDSTTNDISSGSSYAQYAEGHSAESPYSTSSDSNMYASSESTGYALYSFAFTSSIIPSDAVIENIEVRCYGHRESSTIDSTHVSQCALYLLDEQISETVDFPSTSNSIITLTPTTMPARSDMNNIFVRHYVGYYGGLVLGISFEVTYSTGGGITHYTYTYTVDGDATIVVTIGGASNSIFFKQNGSWVEATKVYKKINGVWVEQTDLTTVFDSNTNYILEEN